MTTMSSTSHAGINHSSIFRPMKMTNCSVLWKMKTCWKTLQMKWLCQRTVCRLIVVYLRHLRAKTEGLFGYLFFNSTWLTLFCFLADIALRTWACTETHAYRHAYTQKRTQPMLDLHKVHQTTWGKLIPKWKFKNCWIEHLEKQGIIFSLELLN